MGAGENGIDCTGMGEMGMSKSISVISATYWRISRSEAKTRAAIDGYTWMHKNDCSRSFKVIQGHSRSLLVIWSCCKGLNSEATPVILLTVATSFQNTGINKTTKWSYNLHVHLLAAVWSKVPPIVHTWQFAKTAVNFTTAEQTTDRLNTKRWISLKYATSILAETWWILF